MSDAHGHETAPKKKSGGGGHGGGSFEVPSVAEIGEVAAPMGGAAFLAGKALIPKIDKLFRSNGFENISQAVSKGLKTGLKFLLKFLRLG